MNDVHFSYDKPGRSAKDRQRITDEMAGLVDLARRTIAREGFRGLNARQFAKAAGISVGKLYTLFGNLDGLILAANLPTLVSLRHHLAQADRPDEDVETRLLTLTDAYIDFADREGLLWCALFEHQMDAAPDVVAAELSQSFGILETILAGARIPRDRRPVLAKALWSGVHGIVYLGRTGGLGPIGPESVREMAHLLVKTIAKGLTEPRP
jgi:AcrR family transcriptional regulator